jgi:hypothetical protein
MKQKGKKFAICSGLVVAYEGYEPFKILRLAI